MKRMNNLKNVIAAKIMGGMVIGMTAVAGVAPVTVFAQSQEAECICDEKCSQDSINEESGTGERHTLWYIKSWMRMEKNIQHLKHLLRRKKQINGKKKLSTSSLSENLRFKSVQH